MQTPEPVKVKRFYKSVSFVGVEDEYGLTLDDREAKTPTRNPLTMPTRALAHSVLNEWDAQKETIDFSSMPMTGYQMTVIDSAPREHEAWRDEISRFLSSDLVCYRAESPSDLVERQANIWGGVLKSLSQHLGIHLITSTGIIFIDQPSDDQQKAAIYLKTLSIPKLLVTRRISELTGSAALGLLASIGVVDAQTTIEAAQLDEVYQAEKWGEDEEASARRAAISMEISQAFKFLELSE